MAIELFNEIWDRRCQISWGRAIWFLHLSLKNNGDIHNCVNYKNINLMSHTIKLRENVSKRILLEGMRIAENHFGFLPGRSTTKAIYHLWESMGRYNSKTRDLHIVFIDLEKTYDWVPREMLWKILWKRKVFMFLTSKLYEKGVHVSYSPWGENKDIPKCIWLHQSLRLTLKSLLV